MPKHRFDQPPVHRPREERDAEHHSERTSQPRDATAEVVEQDLVDMDAAVKERLAREAAEPDAATVVELEARARAIEKLPATACDMIAATIASADEGVLNDLSIRFGQDNHIFMLANALEQRVHRFFTANGEANNPSYYAGLVHRALTGQLEANEQRAFTEFQFYFTQEVNPLLQELYKTLQHAPDNGIKSEEEFWQLLQAGEAQQQRTTSVFGVLRLLGPQLDGLARLDIQAIRPQQRIVVENPLSVDRKAGYWEERLRLQEVYGEATLPRMIALRSNIVVETLRTEIACTPEDEQHEDLRAAYEIVAQWCETHLQAFTEPSAEEPEEFGFLIRRLHFAQGESEDVVDFLNAAEVIKRQNPELFERMAGIAPRYDHGTRGDYELGESDMFGSVFHLGLHRSLELTIRSNSSVNQLLHHRITSLTELNRPQPLLQHLNADQIQLLEDQFKSQLDGLKTGTNLQNATTAVIALMQSRLLFEAKLPQMLEAIRSQEWDEQREYLIERLRIGTPKKFIHHIKLLPEFLLHDPEIEAILRARIFDKRPGTAVKYYEKKYFLVGKKSHHEQSWLASTATELSQIIKGRVPETTNVPSTPNEHHPYQQASAKNIDIARLERDLRCDLWVEATDADLLTADFFEDLQHMSKEQILRAINAHPNISKDEWQTWRYTIEYSLSSINVAAKATEILDISPTLENRLRLKTFGPVLKKILRTMLPEDITQSPSHFFVLFSKHDADEQQTQYDAESQLKQLQINLDQNQTIDSTTREHNNKILTQAEYRIALLLKFNSYNDVFLRDHLKLLNSCSATVLDTVLTGSQKTELTTMVKKYVDHFVHQNDHYTALVVREGIQEPTDDNQEVIYEQPTILQFAERYCADSLAYQNFASKTHYPSFGWSNMKKFFYKLTREQGRWTMRPFVRFQRAPKDIRTWPIFQEMPLNDAEDTIERFNDVTEMWEKVSKRDIPELSFLTTFK